MTHTTGLNRGTRAKFSKPFRGRGAIKMSKYLTTYKMGEIVDVKADGAHQKGRPHKIYHGRTGKIFSISKRGMGVVVNKRVNNRIEPKRIYIGIEHIQKSKSRAAFLERVKKNDLLH
jgi:large subunit ribosomal protein L21e